MRTKPQHVRAILESAARHYCDVKTTFEKAQNQAKGGLMDAIEMCEENGIPREQIDERLGEWLLTYEEATNWELT